MFIAVRKTIRKAIIMFWPKHLDSKDGKVVWKQYWSTSHKNMYKYVHKNFPFLLHFRNESEEDSWLIAFIAQQYLAHTSKDQKCFLCWHALSPREDDDDDDEEEEEEVLACKVMKKVGKSARNARTVVLSHEGSLAPTPAPKRKAGAKPAASEPPAQEIQETQELPVKKRKIMPKMRPPPLPEPETSRRTRRNSAAGPSNAGLQMPALLPPPHLVALLLPAHQAW
ncbi:hypothetical protein FRC08_008382 [Ceratobasidium sp. 394]|nr:hypothetical protein FRC08_008382 [Ceratobasidium sp. 394]